MILVDLLIVLLIIYFGLRGWQRGFIFVLMELLGFLVSAVVAGLTYHAVGLWLGERFRIAGPLAGILAFGLVWLLVESVYYVLARRLAHKLPLQLLKARTNQVGGAAFNALKALAVITIGLIIFAGLPLSAATKSRVTDSFLARRLLNASGQMQQQVNKLIGQSINDTLNFLTVKPQSQESVELGFTTTNVRDNAVAERMMLDLVNRERTSRGLQALVMNKEIQKVARKHSRDMFARGYFSHVNPDGLDPFDRMEAGGIQFNAAGENLALAPTTLMAHNGLMNSPGHRANILEPSFRRIGIGAIDGGPYGLMFTQNFAD